MVRRARASRVASAAGAFLVAAIALALVIGLRAGAPSGLQRCTIGTRPAECERFAVPENPGDPGGRKIELNVAVLRATGGHAKPDPLFWFAGWGGAGVTDDAANVISALGGVNIDRDLVFVDQRGTGSSKLDCPRLPSEGPNVSGVAVTAAARQCAERLGSNLRHYTSAVAVDDFDRVRQALGYDKINIYGGSYGVTTGLIYLLRHGSHVRTAVFDSGSLLDVRIFESAAQNAQRALGLLFARCAADTACHTAYPKLRREFAAVQARLAKSPIGVPGAPVPLSSEAFAGAVEELLTTPAGKAILPRLIHLIATGQIARAAALVAPYRTTGHSPLAYQLLIQCSEPWASWRRAVVSRRARGTFMQAKLELDARFAAAVCRGFPKAPVPAAIGRRVHSRVPVLFLTGNEDPADPPASVAHARRELPRSRTVIFPASGHGQLGYLCSQNLIADFIARGTAAGLNSSCARTAVQQPFDFSG